MSTNLDLYSTRQAVNKLAQDGIELEAGDIEIGAVEIKDATTDVRQTVETVGSKGAATVQIVDDTGNQITAFGSPSTIAEYMSPSDFSAAYTSTTTLTLSSVSFDLTDSSQVVYIRVVPASGDAEVFVNGSGGVTMTVSSNILTIAGAGTPFTAGDVYEIGINGDKKAYGKDNDVLKVANQAPIPVNQLDSEPLVTAQDLTAAYADFGAEIDMRGFDRLAVYVVADVNDSEDVDLQFLGLDENGGSDEYDIDATSVVRLWSGAGTDYKKVYMFDSEGLIPSIQLQAIAGTLGATAGDLTIKIIKSKS